jgi:hypothetical protein
MSRPQVELSELPARLEGLCAVMPGGSVDVTINGVPWARLLLYPPPGDPRRAPRPALVNDEFDKPMMLIEDPAFGP